MATLSKDQGTEVDLSQTELPVNKDDPKNKGTEKSAKSKDAKGKSEKGDNDKTLEIDLKTGKEIDAKTKSPAVKLKDEIEVSVNNKPLQNLKSPNSDFASSQLRKQFLADEIGTRSSNPYVNSQQRTNTPPAEKPNYQTRQAEQNLLQQMALQQGYMQMLKEKITSFIRPNASQQNTEPPQKRSEQTKQENIILPQKGLLSFIDRAVNNPAIQAWHRQNTENNSIKELAKDGKPQAAPLVEKPLKSAPVMPIPERIAGAFKSLWEIVRPAPDTKVKDLNTELANVLSKQIAIKQAQTKQVWPAETVTVHNSLANPVKREIKNPQPEEAPKIKSNNMVDDLQKQLLFSIKARSERQLPVDDAKIKVIIKESVELKRFVEHIQKQDPAPSQASREQLQRTVHEAMRIAGAQMPRQVTVEQAKILVADAMTKLGALYGVPLGDQNKNEQLKNDLAKRPPGEPPKSPPVPPPGFNPAAAFSPQNPAGSVDGRAPGFFKDPFAKKEPDTEKPEKKERPEKEDKDSDNDDPDNLEGVFPDYKKKIKDDRFLTIQKTYTLSGKVMEKEGQQGISGVFINGGSLGTAVTNFAGEFKFYNVPEGKIYTLTFLKRGYKFSPSSITDTLDGPHRHYVYGSSE